MTDDFRARRRFAPDHTTVARLESTFGTPMPDSALFSTPWPSSPPPCAPGRISGGPRVAAINPRTRPSLLLRQRGVPVPPLAYRPDSSSRFWACRADRDAAPAIHPRAGSGAAWRRQSAVGPGSTRQAGPTTAIAYEIASNCGLRERTSRCWHCSTPPTPGKRRRSVARREFPPGGSSVHREALRQGGVRRVSAYIAAKWALCCGSRAARSFPPPSMDRPADRWRSLGPGHVGRYRSYHPLPYSGGVAVFTSSIRYPEEPLDPAEGWRPRLAALEVHEIPGDHWTIFLEPYVEILAQALRPHLILT